MNEASLRGKNTVLVIPVYNRPNYLYQCIESLRKLNRLPNSIIFVDDASTESGVSLGINAFIATMPHAYIKITHEANMGVRGSVKSGCAKAFEEMGAELVIVLDGDAIVKPNFITRLVHTHNSYGNITSGFNTHNIKNPIEATGDGVVFKKHVNGINVCFNHEQYDKYVAPSLELVGNWDYNTSLACQKDGHLFTITAPSVVQHIGLVSSMGHTAGGVKADTAYDFD